MNEISSSKCETPIDSLPEEILHMIFDRLELEHVKTASLTCCRWHNIIFLGAYIKRFQFRIAPPIEAPQDFQVNAQLWMKQALHTVNHNQRGYRNVLLIVAQFLVPDNFWLQLWKALLAKLTQHIHWLQLYLPSHLDNRAISVLADGIRSMPKLRSLSLYKLPLRSCQQIVLSSSTVEHLEVSDGYNIRVDMPVLQSFTGPLGALAQPFNNNNEPKVLTTLKHVSATEGPDDVSNLSIIQRLVHVETLRLLFPLEDDNLLMAICDTCSALKELCIVQQLNVTNPTTIRKLFKLVNLRKLIFKSIRMERSWPNSFDVDLSMMKLLEVLDLGSKVFWKPSSLIRFPQSIRCLTVPVTAESESGVIRSITCYLIQLQTLRLIYSGSRYNTVDAQFAIQSHRHLKRLKVLEFVNAEFEKPGFCTVRQLLMLNHDSHYYRIQGLNSISFPRPDLTSAGYI
ncbi:uncharacterized protein LOC118463365 [Anopheles albimanus]|uniref:F-box domain-containing protein n=1 Tax=Anopheles albimanus TaxID=7167 RepID=A0A182FYE5_ANOAL|nr:uncharacterized protein LOC118463365 [Anopheles albimanus]